MKFITSNLYLFIPVPGGGASSKRRHSFQSGVPGLTKEMDRLKVSHTAAEGGGHHSRGVSPRGSTRRRASAARRTSRGKRACVFFTRIHDNDITILGSLHLSHLRTIYSMILYASCVLDLYFVDYLTCTSILSSKMD